ncbi:MAG: hypothetical protein M3Y49_15555 [Actinomycetota bacterium]|nr:hypothetical protein [Actinomycetota bacterium]
MTTPEGFPRIAEKLAWIINTIPTEDGRRLTPERLSRKIFEQTGGEFEVTAGHIQALKTGLRDKPSARLLVEIARAAGLPSAFFWSDVADRLLREVVENAIRDRNSSAASSYDALLLKADPDLSSERLDRLRSLLLAVMGDSAANSDDTP